MSSIQPPETIDVALKVPAETWGRFQRLCAAFGLNADEEAMWALDNYICDIVYSDYEAVYTRRDVVARLNTHIIGNPVGTFNQEE